MSLVGETPEIWPPPVRRGRPWSRTLQRDRAARSYPTLLREFVPIAKFAQRPHNEGVGLLDAQGGEVCVWHFAPRRGSVSVSKATYGSVNSDVVGEVLPSGCDEPPGGVDAADSSHPAANTSTGDEDEGSTQATG